MAIYNVNSLGEIIDGYQAGQEWLSAIDLDISPEENQVAPLEMLRAFQQERTLEAGVALATKFVINKDVTFTKEGEVLLSFKPAGKPLDSYFVDHPYLFDVLLSTAWGILLKKLTPPSRSSAVEEPALVR